MENNPIGSFALAFVVVSRVLVFALLHAVGTPLKFVLRRLPETPGPSFSRLSRLRSWVVGGLSARSPEWVEYHGSGMIMLKTTRGSDRLDALVERIPDRVFALWRRFGIAVMTVCLVAWGVLLLAFVGVALRALLRLATSLASAVLVWLTTFDWRSLFEPRPRPAPPDLGELLASTLAALPDLLYGLGVFLVAALAFVALYVALMWIMMLPLIPGLALHEFGHYAAIRNAGGSVESYGLMLYGPVLAGAYVEPGEDAEELPVEDSFAVWAGGIANTMLWALCLLGAAVALGVSVPAVVASVQAGGIGAVVSHGLPAVLVVLAAFEVGNAFLNTIPAGPVDGGGFIREAEEGWFGVEDLRKSPLSVVASK